MEDITETLWGERVNSGTVSRLNQKIYRHIEAWRNREIVGRYPYVYLDGVLLKRSWAGEVRNVSVLVAIGVGEDGFRHMLWVAEGEKEDLAGGVFSQGLEEAEWQVLWVTQKRSRPPKEAPLLRWACEGIARLGGWLDTKCSGRAGWEAMWHGWFRLQERVDAYLTTHDWLPQKL